MDGAGHWTRLSGRTIKTEGWGMTAASIQGIIEELDLKCFKSVYWWMRRGLPHQESVTVNAVYPPHINRYNSAVAPHARQPQNLSQRVVTNVMTSSPESLFTWSILSNFKRMSVSVSALPQINQSIPMTKRRFRSVIWSYADQTVVAIKSEVWGLRSEQYISKYPLYAEENAISSAPRIIL